MRKTTVLAAVLALAAAVGGPPPVRGGPAPDPGIEAAARDYLEGWFTGDAERMARALHPDLVKRAFLPDRGTGEVRLDQITREALVDYTGRGGGKRTGLEQARITVEVLDVFGDIATVKTTCSQFVDYIHLARVDGEWKIMNVLWALN
jgi:hypothetical protein